MLKKFISLFCCLIMISGCDEQTNNHKALTLGVSCDYPPFASQSNGEKVGFEIDLARDFARSQNLDFIVRDMDFSSLIPALKSNKVDFVISAMTPTPERRVFVDFSDKYYHGYITLVSKKDNFIKDFSALFNKKVGVQIGTVWHKLADDKAKTISGMKVVSLGLTPQIFEELKNGRIDAVIIEKDQAVEFCKANPTLTYQIIGEASEGYAAAFKKGSALNNKFNIFLRQYLKSGEMQKLHDKWLVK